MKKELNFEPKEEDKKIFFNEPKIDENINLNNNINIRPREKKIIKEIIPTKKILKFQTNDEDINKKTFEYDSTISIENMLLDFLSKTNSKITLGSNQIAFLYASRVINQQEDLQKPIGEIFRKKNNIPIKVIDTGNVIGGN